MAVENEINKTGEELAIGEIIPIWLTMLFLNLKILVNLLEEILIL